MDRRDHHLLHGERSMLAVVTTITLTTLAIAVTISITDLRTKPGGG